MKPNKMETDRLVDYVRTILQAQTCSRREQIERRLAGFERINWNGLKARLRNHPQVFNLPLDAQTQAEFEQLQLEAVVVWIEEVLANEG